MFVLDNLMSRPVFLVLNKQYVYLFVGIHIDGMVVMTWNVVSLYNDILIVETMNDCFIFNVIGKESVTALAVEAARNALQMAQVDPDDVDLVLMCSSTPDDLFGSAPQVW